MRTEDLTSNVTFIPYPLGFVVSKDIRNEFNLAREVNYIKQGSEMKVVLHN